MDLPILGNEVWIKLKCRKFYCRNKQCNTRIFNERFQTLFPSRKRKTDRVQERILKVALLLGGNGGEKICRPMNIPVSSSSLIRSIHQKEDPAVQTPGVVGLDDWAYRKGLKYGTVLVDMERRKIIDLLPDREADTVERWLKQHPEIKVVSRDRYINYANAVSKALPEAQQVADRWHLIKNLGDAVKKVLERTQGTLKQKARLSYVEEPLEQEGKLYMPVKTQKVLVKKQEKMDELKRLFKKGIGIRAISREL